MSGIYTKLNVIIFGIVIILFISKTFIKNGSKMNKSKLNNMNKTNEKFNKKNNNENKHVHSLDKYDGISELWKGTFFAWSKRWETTKPFPEFVKFIKENSKYSKFLKNSKVLEVGCGSGNLTNYLHNRGVDIEGCDVSTNAVINAQASSTNNKIIFRQCDVLELKYFKKKYDVIIECSLLQNMNNVERSKYINNLKQILTENGMIISLNVNDNNEYKKGPPNPLSKEDYKKIFNILDWRIIEFRETKYLTKVQDFNAWFVIITKINSNL